MSSKSSSSATTASNPAADASFGEVLGRHGGVGGRRIGALAPMAAQRQRPLATELERLVENRQRFVSHGLLGVAIASSSESSPSRDRRLRSRDSRAPPGIRCRRPGHVGPDQPPVVTSAQTRSRGSDQNCTQMSGPLLHRGRQGQRKLKSPIFQPSDIDSGHEHVAPDARRERRQALAHQLNRT